MSLTGDLNRRAMDRTQHVLSPTLYFLWFVERWMRRNQTHQLRDAIKLVVARYLGGTL